MKTPALILEEWDKFATWSKEAKPYSERREALRRAVHGEQQARELAAQWAQTARDLEELLIREKGKS